MHTEVDDQLLREIRLYRLVFTCESCAHYDEEQASCSQGYPVAEHRGQVLEPGRLLAFCKMFEV